MTDVFIIDSYDGSQPVGKLTLHINGNKPIGGWENYVLSPVVSGVGGELKAFTLTPIEATPEYYWYYIRAGSPLPTVPVVIESLGEDQLRYRYV